MCCIVHIYGPERNKTYYYMDYYFEKEITIFRMYVIGYSPLKNLKIETTKKSFPSDTDVYFTKHFWFILEGVLHSVA